MAFCRSCHKPCSKSAGLCEECLVDHGQDTPERPAFRGEYFFLSNFYPCKVIINGRTFPSSEHAFVSFKSNAKLWKDHCTLSTVSPQQIKLEGKNHTVKDWEKIQLGVMENVLRAKFTQNAHIKRLLLLTGDKELVEINTWNDKFWGVCKGEGLNHLGRLLMQIRSELKMKIVKS